VEINLTKYLMLKVSCIFPYMCKSMINRYHIWGLGQTPVTSDRHESQNYSVMTIRKALKEILKRSGIATQGL
jgi:hypothetical protein